MILPVDVFGGQQNLLPQPAAYSVLSEMFSRPSAGQSVKP